MAFIPELLIFALVVFLYWVFVLAKDDFILLRKNVTLEQLFNIAFIGFFVGITFARGFYVAEHLSSRYLDPLVLFLFPYFPGLSVAGGVTGAFLFTLFRASRKKIPFGRILDIFSISLFGAWSAAYFFFVLITITTTKKFIYLEPVSFLFYALIFVLTYWLFARSKMQDGSIGFLGVGFFSIARIAFNIFQNGIPKGFSTRFEDIFLGIIFFVFMILFIKQEKIFLTRKNRKK